jgi:hypothetical protein
LILGAQGVRTTTISKYTIACMRDATVQTTTYFGDDFAALHNVVLTENVVGFYKKNLYIANGL